jgi:hypothetical protein
VRDSAGIRLVDVATEAWAGLPTWTLSKSPAVSIGRADGAEPYLLTGAFDATRLSDGKIAILNGATDEVRVFGSDGVHVRSIGRTGQGPGEFGAPTWLGRMAGDSLAVYDTRNQRVSVFDSSGALGRMWTPVHDGSARLPEPVGMLTTERIVARAGFDRIFTVGERRDSVPILLLSRDGKPADTLAVLAGQEEFFLRTPDFSTRRPVGFGRNMHAAVGADRIAAGSSDRYEFSVFDSTGTLITRVRSTRASPTVSAAELEQWRARLATERPDFVDEATWGPLMAQVPSRPTHPAFSAIAIDALGHTWVAEAGAATESGVQWTVFTPSGEPAALVVIPAGFGVLEIGADYVLGRLRDDDGVERIEVYELKRSSG